jgi:transposase InsO family protein
MTEEQAAQLAVFYAGEERLVDALRAAGWSQTKALRLLGIAASTWQYRRRPRPKVDSPKPHRARTATCWLTEVETAAITGLLMAAFDDRKSVYQAYHEALDAGTPVASLSSWYRVAAAYLDALRPVRRRRARRKSAGMPQWEADAVLQVWSWDVTWLPGPYRGVNYAFYVALDVFSRKIVAWRVEECEDDELATQMFAAAFEEYGATPRIVHSDGGSVMTSKTLAALFADLGITASRNRPRVSNDNPFSEAWFKTAKYWPGYPGYFDTLERARRWAGTLVRVYNTEHRHSALEGHTPASVHDGTWIDIHHARQATLDALYEANPGRYAHPPHVKTPLGLVALNKKQTKQRLQTG